jgi:Cu+-exporting ATPase
VDTQTAKVTPKPKAVLSPKALWEAVEKAKKTPAKLEGPSGTFTAKPKK